MRPISLAEMRSRLAHVRPTNNKRADGYALVSVLEHEDFVDNHLPGSINIPKGDELEFEDRFDQSKVIIVYCGSRKCLASSEVARELERRGFYRLLIYVGGIQEWQNENNPIETGEAPSGELRA